ncbi:penicillin-binding transpeptidase domain-containing protein [Marasmitruncus massiliensis]|uniref:penicillin-binding transpeptidase domain-containing protein n=1 Tax=Marasmitruncus massiliensis TaxID=1944642 RepID=UPI000C7DAFE5|nr:penicillin-binding transpeptidase domain-containing protein [Marasmitruncus massiliensis]
MKSASQTLRIIILAAVTIVLLLLYSLCLMQMQVVNGETFANIVEQGTTKQQRIKAARGEILDRNGRPLAVNALGRDVTIDKAYLPRDQMNEVILRLIKIMEDADEDWIDNLPLTETAPFAFKEGEGYENAIATLKKTLGMQQYATAENVVENLRKVYDLEKVSDADFRKAAGVRYEMQRLDFSISNPYTFATDIKIETVPKIKERSFELPGVDVVESTIRQYVSGDVAPHVIGSIGKIYQEQWEPAEKVNDGAVINGLVYQMTDMIGKEGAELAFEQYLKGQDGQRQITLNSSGDVIDVVEEKEQVPGNTVILTIDSQLQKVAQEALENKIHMMQNDLVTYPPGKGHEADAGAVAVVNVKTGEILALATYPSYNLTTFRQDYAQLSEDPLRPMFNRALNGTYTPGSIFKPVIALGALSEGVVTPTDTVNCTGVYTRWTSWQPRCLSAHGLVNVMDALKHSCNIYFYDVGYRLGIEKIDEYAAKLGLGLPTGIELPEAVGRVSSPEVKEQIHQGDDRIWQDGDTVQASIGQLDTKLSPLQLANYAATLANNGERMKLTLLKSVKSYTFDETLYEHQPEVAEEIDSSAAFAAIREGMERAAGLGGTAGAVFGNYPIQVACKTGTPETHADPNSTFIAYAPAEDPQIAVCVVIEKGWHGYTGGPVAKEIFDSYFFSNKGKTSASIAYGTLLS